MLLQLGAAMMLLETASDELLESSDGGSQRLWWCTSDEIDVKKPGGARTQELDRDADSEAL